MASRCFGVSATGSGDGSNWNNMAAYANVNSVLTRAGSDVGYLSEGIMPSVDLFWATSGTNRIGIKKATAADHGPATGWADSIGDGPTIWNEGFVNNASYFDFDGARGGGPNVANPADPTTWQTGFGFEIHASDSANAHILNQLDQSVQVTNMTISHVAFTGPTGGGTDNGKPLGLRLPNCQDVLVDYCYFKDTSGPLWGWGKRLIFQRCFYDFFLSTGGNHAEIANFFGGTGIEELTWRWSWMNFTDGTGGLVGCDDGGLGDFRVYGNLFYAYNPGSKLAGGNGLITSISGRSLSGIKVYNNTFVNVGQGSNVAPVIGVLDTGGGNCQNNLFYNTTSFGNIGLLTTSHNHFASSGAGSGTNVTTSSGDPFRSLAGGDLRLLSNTTGGTNLGAPYNTDMFGNTRTTWTRGAIEFQASAAGGGRSQFQRRLITGSVGSVSGYR